MTALRDAFDDDGVIEVRIRLVEGPRPKYVGTLTCKKIILFVTGDTAEQCEYRLMERYGQER